MDRNERHHEEQGTARDQERLRRLAHLPNAGPVESLITQLVRDSRGTSVALMPGIEYALSAAAGAAATAGEGVQAWQAAGKRPGSWMMRRKMLLCHAA
jgi:hypothetical protein